MTPTELLEFVLKPVQPFPRGDLRAFLKASIAVEGDVPSDFDRLARRAVMAKGRLEAGAAGHQAAIRRLFPTTPADAVTAFCVSEDQGPKPSAILASLVRDGDGWTLNGTKRWGSMSPLADILYIAASIGEHDGRNHLRMVRIPKAASGVIIDTSPYGRYVDHMPIADIRLTDVRVSDEDVLSADAYVSFIKPFRLIEDVYSVAALQIALFCLGRRCGWPEAILEDTLGLIMQAHAISQTTMAKPGDVLLMSAYFRASIGLWARLEECWSLTPEDDREAFAPQTGLLGVAARAREARRQTAWRDLTSA